MLPSVRAEELTLAPDFSLPELRGGVIHTLSAYRGKIVLVDFWASWCGPCRASFPAYEALYQRLGGSPETAGSTGTRPKFEILAINVDVTAEEGLAFLDQSPVSFTVLREATGSTQQNYQLIAMPTSFLVDPDGRILIAHHGFSPGYVALLEDTITRLRTAP